MTGAYACAINPGGQDFKLQWRAIGGSELPIWLSCSRAPAPPVRFLGWFSIDLDTHIDAFDMLGGVSHAATSANSPHPSDIMRVFLPPCHALPIRLLSYCARTWLWLWRRGAIEAVHSGRARIASRADNSEMAG